MTRTLVQTGRALTAALVAVSMPCGALAQALDDTFRDRFANPEDTFALGAYIRQAVADGQYDQAISSLEEHLIRQPQDGAAYLALAHLYGQTGAWDLAATQAQAAIDTGTLSGAEAGAAMALIKRAKQASDGIEWFLETGATYGLTITDVAVPQPASDWLDRQKSYGGIYAAGALRLDLGTALDSAMILSASGGWDRKYEAALFGATGGMVNLGSGRVAATLDLGLPVESFDAARFQITASAATNQSIKNARENAFGASARLVLQPTVNTEFYTEAGWFDLSQSENMTLESRIAWAAGASWRLSPGATVAVKASGADETNRDGTHARSTEGELSVSGLLPWKPLGNAWGYRISGGGGPFSIDATASTNAITGHQWHAGLENVFAFDGGRRVEVGYTYSETLFDGAAASGNVATHDLSVAFVQQF